jgi:hypothetical protein
LRGCKKKKNFKLKNKNNKKCCKEVMGTFGVGVWKHIRRGEISFPSLLDLRGGGRGVIFKG